MSFHTRKLCPSPGKLKQATLSISVNKIDNLLPLKINKVDSIFLLGLSPETITVAIFFILFKDNTKRNITEELLCGHDSSKPS